MRTAAARYAILLAGVAVIIVYGSLYPFDFSGPANLSGGLKGLLSTWRSLDGWGHIVGNALLYVPLGFCLVRAVSPGSGFSRVLMAGLAGLLLSASIEIAQIHDRTRDPSMSDVYANTAGAMAGAAVGVLAIHGARRNARFERHPFSSLMVLCWLGNRLFPYVPSLSVDKYASAIKPLSAMAAIPLDDVFRNFANWLAVAILIEAIFGRGRSRTILAWLVAATLAARIVVVGVIMSPAEVVGAAAAALIWAAWLSRVHARTAIVTILFTASVILQALEPFKFLAEPRPFGFIPFRSFIISIEFVVPVFFEKAFTYGVLVWLAIRARMSFASAATCVAVLQLVLRLIQVYLPGRSAEITDALMVLMLAAGLKLMGEDPLSEEA